MFVYLFVLLLCYYCVTKKSAMTGYTLRPIFRKDKKNKDNIAPLCIVFTQNRKRTYIKTAYRLHEDNWNGKEVTGLPNAVMINAAIRQQIAQLDKEILARQLQGKPVSAKSVKYESAKNFYSFVKAIRKPITKKDKKEMNRLIAYAGENLLVSDIGYSWLNAYEIYQRSKPNKYKGVRKIGLAQNTINTTFKWLRSILNEAENHGVIKEAPIGKGKNKYKVPKGEQTERVFLIKSEREQWFKFWQQKEINEALHITLTYFLIGVFTGLRHQDWQHAISRVDGKFIRLRATKNKQWVVQPIGKSLSRLLKVAQELPPPYSDGKSRDHLKIIAGILRCRKNVTTHTARHSFGTMCAELGLPKSVTAELMGISVDTVEVYYHLTGQNILQQAAALKGV